MAREVRKSKRGTSQSEVPLFVWIGSPGRTRTCDQPVNSRLLYQLSYRGTRQSVFGRSILAKDIGWREIFFCQDNARLPGLFATHRNLLFRPHPSLHPYYLLRQMRNALPRSDRDYRYRAWYQQP